MVITLPLSPKTHHATTQPHTYPKTILAKFPHLLFSYSPSPLNTSPTRHPPKSSPSYHARCRRSPARSAPRSAFAGPLSSRCLRAYARGSRRRRWRVGRLGFWRGLCVSLFGGGGGGVWIGEGRERAYWAFSSSNGRSGGRASKESLLLPKHILMRVRGKFC